jgi:hypothetical protein
MAIFGIMLTVLYPTLSVVSSQVNDLSAKQELTQKGQRVMDYIGEELRLAGLFVGSRPSITFCGEPNPVNSLEQTDGNPNDAVTFLTSERITTTTSGKPFLTTDPTANAFQGNTVLTVNAAGTAVSAITPSTTTTSNGRSFITFDTLQPNLGLLVYQVTAYGGVNLTITPALDQQVNRLSNAYAVVRKRFMVDAARSLKLVLWNSDCSTANTTYDIVASHGTGNVNGGVDGFQIEYVPATGTTAVPPLAAADIENVRAIRIWVLLRSDFPTQSYVNNTTYTLGNAYPVQITVNDHYRRVLLSKIVEVKNVGL